MNEEITQTEERSRGWDEELKTIAAILRALADHDQPTQRRIMNYLGDRFSAQKGEIRETRG